MEVSTLLASFLETGIQILASPVYVVGAVGAMVGAVCLIVGSLVKTMIPLRWLALSSNLGFIVFSIAEASALNALVQFGLLGINIFRLTEMKQLTRRVTEASMAADLSGLWLRPYMFTGKLRAGDHLFRAGDRADHLYFLADGRIELVEIATFIEAGTVFGEIAFFAPNGKRTMTARCVGACTILSIDESTLRQLYFQNPTFGFQLIGLLAGRLTADVERLRFGSGNQQAERE